MDSGALSGVKVLDFTIAAVGPFCSRILADMGAEVIRIEWPRQRKGGADEAGSETRFSREGMDAGSEILFLHCNGGKKSVAVNLKEGRGRALVLDLVKVSDIVVSNFTPHVMTSYGLNYDALKKVNPGIIMCSLTGYGEDGYGGYTDHPCSDPIGQAMSGLAWLTGERDGVPYAIGGGIGDTITGMAGAVAVLGALVHKRANGEGQHIAINMAEANLFVDCTSMPYAAANNGKSIVVRNGQQNTYTFPMGPFRAAGGEYLALQAPGKGHESNWGRLCGLMGRPELIDDPRYETDQARISHSDEVIGFVEAWLTNLPDREAGLEALRSARISSGPVFSQTEMLQHEFFAKHRTFASVNYPGVGDVTVVEPPYKFSATPAHVQGPAPEFGEHNRDVLGRYLNLSDAELEALNAEGVLYESAGARRRNAVPQEAGV